MFGFRLWHPDHQAVLDDATWEFMKAVINNKRRSDAD